METRKFHRSGFIGHRPLWGRCPIGKKENEDREEEEDGRQSGGSGGDGGDVMTAERLV